MITPNRIKAFPPRETAEDLGEFLHDVIVLGELQARLFTAETRVARRRLSRTVVLAATAATIALGAIPVLLAALASALVDQGFALTTAIATAAGVGTAISGGLAVAAYLSWRCVSAPYQQSIEELKTNVACLKQSLAGRSGPAGP